MKTVHANKRLWSKSEAGQAEMMCLLSMMAGARREVGNCFGGRGLVGKRRAKTVTGEPGRCVDVRME